VGWGALERWRNIQEAEEEHDQERNLCALWDPERREHPERQPEDQNVGGNVEGGGEHVEHSAVDAVAATNGRIPVESDRRALQDNGEEDSNHLRDVGDIEPEKKPPDPVPLAKETAQEDHNR
jgi:hypothetical protein